MALLVEVRINDFHLVCNAEYWDVEATWQVWKKRDDCFDWHTTCHRRRISSPMLREIRFFNPNGAGPIGGGMRYRGGWPSKSGPSLAIATGTDVCYGESRQAQVYC
jgi:hypothetical protein